MPPTPIRIVLCVRENCLDWQATQIKLKRTDLSRTLDRAEQGTPEKSRVLDAKSKKLGPQNGVPSWTFLRFVAYSRLRLQKWSKISLSFFESSAEINLTVEFWNICGLSRYSWKFKRRSLSCRNFWFFTCMAHTLGILKFTPSSRLSKIDHEFVSYSVTQ